MRILAAIRYINDDGPRLYSANEMTIRMTDRLEVAKVKFMFYSLTQNFLQKWIYRLTLPGMQLARRANSSQNP